MLEHRAHLKMNEKDFDSASDVGETTIKQFCRICGEVKMNFISSMLFKTLIENLVSLYQCNYKSTIQLPVLPRSLETTLFVFIVTTVKNPMAKKHKTNNRVRDFRNKLTFVLCFGLN